MSNTLTPHKHGALILDWAQHLASGAVAAGWYVARTESFTGISFESTSPNWDHSLRNYCIVMTDKHPDYTPPTKKIVIELELTVAEIERLSKAYAPYIAATNQNATPFEKLNAAINKALKESK